MSDRITTKETATDRNTVLTYMVAKNEAMKQTTPVLVAGTPLTDEEGEPVTRKVGLWVASDKSVTPSPAFVTALSILGVESPAHESKKAAKRWYGQLCGELRTTVTKGIKTTSLNIRPRKDGGFSLSHFGRIEA